MPQTLIRERRPRISNSSTKTSPSVDRSETYVPSASSTAWGVSFVRPSIRDAVFTVSPITAYSCRRSEPTLPDMTGPELRPIPIRNPSPIPEVSSHPLNSVSFSVTIDRAAATAMSA